MASIDDLKNLSTPAPTGFKPGIEWTGDTGHVTVAAKPGEEPDRDKINGVIDSSPFLTSDELKSIGHQNPAYPSITMTTVMRSKSGISYHLCVAVRVGRMLMMF